MKPAEDLHSGDVIRHENKICKVLEKDLHGHGKVARTVHAKMRDLESGHVIEQNYKTHDKVEVLDAETVKMVYSYPEDPFLVFMNNETYEEVRFNQESLGHKAAFLRENDEIDVLMIEGKPLDIHFPETVILKVTTAPEGVKGSDKEVELENGMKVLVPHFVAEGESVVIKTEDGSYAERVTTKSLKTDAVAGTGGGEKDAE